MITLGGTMQYHSYSYLLVGTYDCVTYMARQSVVQVLYICLLDCYFDLTYILLFLYV